MFNSALFADQVELWATVSGKADFSKATTRGGAQLRGTFETAAIFTTPRSMQNVRAVWNGTEWELHFVWKVELETNGPAGDDVAGIDLGIKNLDTVAFPDEYVLYPGNSLKQDKHYFSRAEYDTEGENGPSEKSMWARRKLPDRETYFYHVLTDTIMRVTVNSV